LNSILQEHGQPLPDNWPKWAVWTYREEFLPEDAHDLENIITLFAILKSDDDWSRMAAEHIVLAAGLLVRDVTKVHSLEDGLGTAGMPAWVVNMPLDLIDVLSGIWGDHDVISQYVLSLLPNKIMTEHFTAVNPARRSQRLVPLRVLNRMTWSIFQQIMLKKIAEQVF
jgi:hypothetical protein